MEERKRADDGWNVIADHDGAATLVATLLEIDDKNEYTKTELSDRAGVPLKSLYLNGTLDAIVDLGLLEKQDRPSEEPLYTVATGSDVFEAALAFDDSVEAAAPDSA